MVWMSSMCFILLKLPLQHSAKYAEWCLLHWCQYAIPSSPIFVSPLTLYLTKYCKVNCAKYSKGNRYSACHLI